MQAFIRRFFCGFCAFAVVILFCVPQVVYAVEDDTDLWDGTSVTNWGDAYLVFCELADVGFHVMIADFSDLLLGESGSSVIVVKNSPFYCEETFSATGQRMMHLFEGDSPSLRYHSCKYCGLSGADWLALLEGAEDEYVDSLLRYASLDFKCTKYSQGSNTHSAASASGENVFGNFTSSVSASLTGKGAWDGSTAVFYNHDYRFCAASFSSGPITLQTGEYTIPSFTYSFNYPHCSVLGTYNWAFRLIRYDNVEKTYTILWDRYVRTDTSGNDSDHVYTGTIPDLTFAAVSSCTYYFGFSCSFGVPGLDYNSYFTLNDPVEIMEADASGTVYDPSDEEQSADEKYVESTRVAFLMDLLAQYNKANSYLENSDAVNYFMGTVDEDGNITGVYGLPEFDEETMVFTEPVTGAQYQCTGWTYDYNTRCYDIALEPGTFILGGSDVAQILCTYGDEYVVIEYYDENGLLLDAQQFVYAMVASNSCALEGHSYSITSTKAPTCTSVGERVYTCSVCGGQKVETIPMNEHAHVYSEIKQPTCTDPGYGVFTCSTCGGQYTETLDPLGHDWISAEVVETTYSLPPGTACPDCSGTEFTWELDELNALYTCTCSACEASWNVNADVELGYTTYKCSRCDETKVEQDGEAGDGLFKSIGNFFADGINWCTEKLTQLVDSLTEIVDTFNEYLDQLPKPGTYPKFLSMFLESLPQELTAVIWFAVIAFVILCVFKIFFR